jgi:transposase
VGVLRSLGMTYPSSLSDTEWDHLQCYLPPTQTRGRPRSHSLRAILNAIFYVLRTGYPWRYLPRDFPPWQTVYYHFRRFRLSGMWHLILTSLRTAERQRVGRDTQPTAAIIDAQSMKTVGQSAPISGYDGHKNLKGRKRHLLVDSLGLPISVYLTPADVQERAGARCLLAGLKALVPRLKKIFSDGAYSGEELARWCEEEGGWHLEVVERDLQSKGFEVLPKRWVVERTFGWLSRNRRLVKDYERRVQTSETLIEVARIRLLLRRLGRAA